MRNDHTEWRTVRYRGVVVLIGILSILAAAGPLLRDGIYNSTDAPYHLSRIEGIYLNLLQGVFPAKVHIAAAYSYGYGTGFFYPNLFLYIPALLMLAGVSLEMSWKLFCILVVVASYLFMAYAIRILCRNSSPIMCVLGAACYILSQQFAIYLYGSQSIGSVCAMMCAPIVVAELLRILWDTHDKWDLLRFVLATCGVVLSHLTTAIITLVFLIVICLCSMRRIANNIRIVRELTLSMLVGAMLTIAFWAPMIEQLTVQLYKFETELIDPISATNETWRDAPESLGYAGLIMLAISIAYVISQYHYKGNDAELIFALVVSSLTFIVITFCPTFWGYFGQWLDWLQFPSRMLNPIMASLLLGFAKVVSNDTRERVSLQQRYIAMVFGILILVSATQFYAFIRDCSQPNHLEEGLITEQIAGLGAGEEWLPDDADRSGLREPNKSYDPDGIGADGFKHDYGKYYEVYVLLDKAYYDVPYLYYKGYEAYLLDDNGAPTEQLKVGKSDRLAYVRVYMPENGDGIGHIMVTYRKTMTQKISYVMNIVAVVGLIATLYMESIKKRRQGRGDNAWDNPLYNRE